MKKLISIMLLAFAFLLLGVNSMSAFTNDNIIQADDSVSINKIVSEYEVLSDGSSNKSRCAGSEGEYNSANRIIELMNKYASNFNKKTSSGIESFSSNFNGKTYNSQNVVFSKNTIKTTKKIVIGVPYDNFNGLTVYNQTYTAEGFSMSSLPTATTIYIASILNNKVLDVNIEIVFFGSDNLNGAGSNYYFLGYNKLSVADTLLYIDMGNIGKDMPYYYADSDSSLKYVKFLNEELVDKNIFQYNSAYDIENINGKEEYGRTVDNFPSKVAKNCTIPSVRFFTSNNKGFFGKNDYIGSDIEKDTKENSSETNIENAELFSKAITDIVSNKSLLRSLDNTIGSAGRNRFYNNKQGIILITALFCAVLYFYCRQYFDKSLSESLKDYSNAKTPEDQLKIIFDELKMDGDEMKKVIKSFSNETKKKEGKDTEEKPKESQNENGGDTLKESGEENIQKQKEDK